MKIELSKEQLEYILEAIEQAERLSRVDKDENFVEYLNKYLKDFDETK